VNPAWFLLFAALLGLDRWTKHLVSHGLSLGQSIPVVGDAVRLTYVENPGMAFGLRLGDGTVFTVFSVLASLFLAAYLWNRRREGALLKAGLVLILSGAVGNLVDRIATGRVVDFVDVGAGTLRWPVFNVADSAVVVGMGLVILKSLSDDRKSRSAKADPAAE
jgi:signal peptidase II